MAQDVQDEALTSQDLDALNDGAETRVYELGFHLDPELPQEEVKKTYQTIRDAVAASGEIVAEGEPIKIPLAYTISRQDTTGRRDFDSAYFAWIAYEANGAAHTTIATLAREEKRIIRFIDLKTTKDEALHAAEMHELFAKGGPDTGMPAEDEVSEVQLEAALKEVEA